MPIYEFKCLNCGTEFEKIVFSTDQKPVGCPKCNETKVEQLMSVCFSGKTTPELGTSSMSSCATSPGGFT